MENKNLNQLERMHPTIIPYERNAPIYYSNNYKKRPTEV